MESRRAELIEGFPMELAWSESKGWYLIASRNILPGELLLQTKAFSSAVHDKFKTKVCSACLSFSTSSKWKLSCNLCREIFYCSKECKERIQEEHQNLECKFFKRIRGPLPGILFDEEDMTEAKLIMRTLAKMAHLGKCLGTKDRSGDVELL